MYRLPTGTTDRTITVFIPDPASTDGSGKTGLTHADLTVSYIRVETDNDVVVTDVTSSLSTLTNLTDAHADWGVKEVSSTLAPGVYRLDIADAVLASGAWEAIVYVMVTSSAASASPVKFLLENVPANVTQFGGTNGTFASGRPEVNTTHWGGTAVASAVVKADLETIKTQTVTCAAGVTVLASVGTAATSTAQTGDSYAIVNDGTNGNAAIKTQVAAIETDTQDIQSRIPAALVNSRMDCTIDGTGMENGAVDAILNRDASGSTTNSTLGAIVNDLEDGGRLDLILDDIDSLVTGNDTYLSDLNVRIPAALTGDGNMKTDVLRINGQLTSAAGTITFPGTIASTTNITGGTITTVTTTTNLTNAPTSGDFTATMKTSIETEVGAVLAGTNVTDFTAIPSGTPNILEALGFLYAQGFYRKEQTATTTTLYDGDNNAVAEATTSDNGTTFVRTRFTAP